MPFALELAKRITALRYEDLPAEAVRWAKVGILDTVGVTLAGSADPSATIVAGVLSSNGPSLVLGTSKRTGPLDAALVNGTASHALDFDDCNNTLGGHPSAPILPALFALADETGASGRDFITAYVAGFETECKISMGVNFYQYTRGWHPTTTIGVFGATAACARLLALDDERTAVALAIAASLASGIKSNFGTYVKPLHIGHCARNGLLPRSSRATTTPRARSPSSTNRAISKCSTARAITTRRKYCLRGASRSTSWNPGLRSSSTPAAAARIRRSMRCSSSCASTI